MKHTALFFILIAVFSLGCTRDTNNYIDREKGFSTTIPQNWEKQKSQIEQVTMFVHQSDGYNVSFKPNISIIAEELKNSQTVDSYVMKQLEGISKIDKGGYELHKKSSSKMDGENSRRIVYTFTMSVHNLKVLSEAVIRNNKGYMITGIAEEENFETMASAFKIIVDNFRFR